MTENEVVAFILLAGSCGLVGLIFYITLKW